jgi:hypothetical protein
LTVVERVRYWGGKGPTIGPKTTHCTPGSHMNLLVDGCALYCPTLLDCSRMVSSGTSPKSRQLLCNFFNLCVALLWNCLTNRQFPRATVLESLGPLCWRA